MQSAFYQRQLVMPEIGTAGQERLHAGRVLVVGAGGLGSPILFGLAGAGVGRIGIIDADRVSASNLNRQYLYTPADCGSLKAEVARGRIAAYHPDLKVEAFPEKLDETHAMQRFSDYDLIIGAVDNNQTRRIINAACCRLGLPWIDGGIQGFSGYAAMIVPGKTPCFDCLFGLSGLPLPIGDPNVDPKADLKANLKVNLKADSVETVIQKRNASGIQEPDKERPGVLGVTAGVIGSWEANLAIAYLLGLPDPLNGELLYYFGKRMVTSRIRIERTPDCPVCGSLFSTEEP